MSNPIHVWKLSGQGSLPSWIWFCRECGGVNYGFAQSQPAAFASAIAHVKSHGASA